MLVEAEVVPGAGAHQVERIASTAAVQARGDSLALDLLLTQLQPPPQGSDHLCKVFFWCPITALPCPLTYSLMLWRFCWGDSVRWRNLIKSCCKQKNWCSCESVNYSLMTATSFETSFSYFCDSLELFGHMFVVVPCALAHNLQVLCAFCNI